MIVGIQVRTSLYDSQSVLLSESVQDTGFLGAGGGEGVGEAGEAPAELPLLSSGVQGHRIVCSAAAMARRVGGLVDDGSFR